MNPQSIIILALILAAFAAVVIKIRKDAKNGKSSCGGNCSACGGCCNVKDAK